MDGNILKYKISQKKFFQKFLILEKTNHYKKVLFAKGFFRSSEHNYRKNWIFLNVSTLS